MSKMSKQAKPARAFTMIEILVTVAALSVIAVGIASIFGTVQKTIAAGKSTSVLTQYANEIERQLRDDFANMTRDGFFVVHHQRAGGGANIPLFEGLDSNPRARRIDQLVFFRKGEFSGQRPALVSGIEARSDSAMVWYGHGQLRPADLNPASAYRRPNAADQNNVTTALLGLPVAGNPNRYASDWTLLRKLVLLANPEVGQVTYPTGPGVAGLALSPAAMRDNDFQVALHPAASSYSRKLSEVVPAGLPAAYVRQGEGVRPRLSSGIVDIVTTSLAEVIAIVYGMSVLPNQVNGLPDVQAQLANKTFTASAARANTIRAWMHEAFPTDPGSGVRMRYEKTMPDFVGAVGSGSPVEKAYRYGDQVALSSSIFAPRCSEFKVEWSFGQLNAAGGLIWHDIDNMYGQGGSNFQIAYERATPVAGGTTLKDFYERWTVDPELIHGSLGFGTQGSAFSYFGTIDPFFNAANPVDQVTGAALASAKESSIPWAWPQLVRVTISLVDSSDPSVERSFRFVFELAGEPGSL